MRVISIGFVRKLEKNPDLSMLGAYSLEPVDGAIDRQAMGHWVKGELRYFVPANPETADLDYQRMEEYGYFWDSLECYAEAVVEVCGSMQSIRSTGLCGVESDSDPGYFEVIKEAEMDHLYHILAALGIKCSPVETAKGGK